MLELQANFEALTVNNNKVEEIPHAFQVYRWRILRNRKNTHITQVTGITLYKDSLSDLDIYNLSSTKLHCSQQPSLPNEDVDKLKRVYNLPGRRYSTNEKWCVLSSSPTLTIHLDKPIQFAGFAFNLGNDCPERDPVEWVFEGTNDERKWYPLHEMKNYSYNPSLQRGDFVEKFAFTQN